MAIVLYPAVRNSFQRINILKQLMNSSATTTLFNQWYESFPFLFYTNIQPLSVQICWAFASDFMGYDSFCLILCLTGVSDHKVAVERIDAALKMVYTNPHCFDVEFPDRIVFCAHCACSIEDEGCATKFWIWLTS
jgi:hypothetical protein